MGKNKEVYSYFWFQRITPLAIIFFIFCSSNTEKEERESCIEELIKLVQKDLKKIIYKHDLCRIVQCLLALKRENIRTLLFDELTPEIVNLIYTIVCATL